MIKLHQPLDPELLQCELVHSDGKKITLGSLISNQVTAILFIRHFGCLGCAVQMTELSPRLHELHQLGLKTLIIGNGQVNFIEGFMERFHLEPNLVTVLTDPSLQIYQKANLKRTLWATFGPKGMWDMAQALVNGHSQQGVKGDNAQQGGTIVLDRDKRVIYFHRNQSLADHASSNDLVDCLYAQLATNHPLYA